MTGDKRSVLGNWGTTQTPTDQPGTRSALQAWYQWRLGADARIVDTSVPSNGAVNETLLHTVRYSEGGRPVTLHNVLRPQPIGETPIPGVDIGQQALTLKALRRVDAAPTPEVLWEESDPKWLGRPFFVMQRMPGKPVFDQLVASAKPSDLPSMFDAAMAALASIHAVDVSQGDFDHLGASADEGGALRRQLDAYRRHLTESSQGKVYPQLEAAYDWLDRHLPAGLPAVLNWGDARMGNLLFHGLELTAVLDWEMAELAPREVDIGWFLYLERFFWVPGGHSREGGLTARELVSLYEQKAGKTLHDLEYFERWAAFRLALMRMRAGRQMIKRGDEGCPPNIDEVNPAAVLMARQFGWPDPS